MRLCCCFQILIVLKFELITYFIQFCRWESWDLSIEMTYRKLQRKSVCQIRQLNYFICMRHWIIETSICLMLISISLAFAHNHFRDVIGITLDMYWCDLEWHFRIGGEFPLICSLPNFSIIYRKAISASLSRSENLVLYIPWRSFTNKIHVFTL